MKKMIFPVVAVLLASCNPSDKQTTQQTAETQTETATTETAPSADSLQVDGITGATNVANASTFNGTLVIPPQHFAAITLPMGGIVKTCRCYPALTYRRGKYWLPWRTRNSLPCNRNIWTAVHNWNTWKPNITDSRPSHRKKPPRRRNSNRAKRTTCP